MGLLKDLRNLRKQAKQLQAQAMEGGLDTSVRGLLKSAPGMLEHAGDALRQVQEGRAEGDRLRTTGIGATARIVAVRDTGMTIGGAALGGAHENPVADLDLEVSFPEGEPYPVTVRQMVPRLAVGRLVPGGEVAVKVDRDDRFNVLVDWEAPV